MPDLLKVLVIPDLQCPNHDVQAVNTAIEIVRGERPDLLVYVGDVVDFKSVARFLDTSWDEAKTTADYEIRSADEVLNQFDKAMPKKTRVVFLEGNHDRRLELFFIQHAAKLGRDFRGGNIRDQLGLVKRGYEYIPTSQQPYKPVHVSKIGFLHGWYTNKYHAAKTVMDGGQCIMYGHTHDFQVFTGLHLDQEAPRIAMSIGCLCNFKQEYLGGKPMNWCHGVGLVYIDQKTGKFWPSFCVIVGGECVIGGKKYRA